MSTNRNVRAGWRGFYGASHGLALGKVLLAGTGAEGVKSYVKEFGLEAFTPRTITQPALFEIHLGRVRERGLAGSRLGRDG